MQSPFCYILTLSSRFEAIPVLVFFFVVARQHLLHFFKLGFIEHHSSIAIVGIFNSYDMQATTSLH